MEYLVNFIISVEAGFFVEIICKWLNGGKKNK